MCAKLLIMIVHIHCVVRTVDTMDNMEHMSE